MVTPPRSALLLLHIWWPLLTGASLVLVVHRATGRPWDPAGAGLLLAGIVAAYSLDRVVDAPPALTPRVRRVLVAAAAGAALTGALLLVWLPLPTGALVPVLAGAAVGYSAVKRLPWGKAIAVPLIWTWSAIALPFGDGSWFGWHWIFEPVAAPLFLLFAAGCLLCDLKDEARDRATGVASVPATLGPTATIAIALALVLTAGGMAWTEGRVGLTCSAVALGGAALRPGLLATDIVGPLVVDMILTLPGVLIASHLI